MGSCGGNCGSCSGCGRELVLTETEMEFLMELGQIPFRSVARRVDDMTPIWLEEGDKEQMSLLLQCLEKKGLISLDYDKPLKGVIYPPRTLGGSLALTERGQKVLELMEYQGVQE